MNYDYVNVSSFRLLSRCFARTRCTLYARGRGQSADRRSGHVLHVGCASSHPAAIDAAMLPKRPLDSQKPNGTRRISASPSRMLSCQRVTRNSGSPTHTHTHTSEAKLGTPPLSHMISLCLVYCGPSATCCGLTRPHRQCSRSPRRVPSIPGALSYFQMDFPPNCHPLFQMAMGRARQRAALTLSLSPREPAYTVQQPRQCG